MMKRLLFVMGLTTALTSAEAAEPAKPLFADDQPIQVTIKGSIGRLVSSEDRSRSVPAIVSMGADSLPAQLSPRGITRLRKDTCDFPPIRVDFTGAPPANSIFAGQN